MSEYSNQDFARDSQRVAGGSIRGGTPLGNFAVDRSAKLVSEESASEIRDRVGQAEVLLSIFDNEITLLEQRLDVVLRPVQPSPTGAAGDHRTVPTPSVSHLRGRLTILNEGFALMLDRLRLIRSRIEV